MVGVLCLLAGAVLVFFSFTGFRSFLFSSRGSLVNTAVFAIVLLVGTSQGQASSAYKNAAADSKTAAAIIGYELLADGTIHKGRVRPRTGFFVKGQIRDGHFIPRGEVRGQGELATSGHPGWIELSDGTFYRDETARQPGRPYIRGYKDSSGKFVPSSRKIVY